MFKPSGTQPGSTGQSCTQHHGPRPRKYVQLRKVCPVKGTFPLNLQNSPSCFEITYPLILFCENL